MGTLPLWNPATGETAGEVKTTTKHEVELAVKVARQTFRTWGNTSLSERLKHLRNLRHRIVEEQESLAEEIQQDTGKVKIEALMADLLPSVAMIRYYEREAGRILRGKRVTTPLIFPLHKGRVEYRPMGAVAVISPWNYPFQLALVPMISALASGNCVLLKPSEVAPRTGLVLERLFREAGFPEGVVQVLHGGRETGQALVEAGPDKIFFTGSVATGKKIMVSAAERLIPVELELGGKDPMLVFADADLDRAVDGALWGAFTNAGQTCMAVERLYVESSIFEPFVDNLIEKTKSLRLYPLEEADIGSMTYSRQLDIVQAHVQDAVDKGATVRCGGKRISDETLHFEPTILTGVNHEMDVMREETFGPILPIMPFQTEEEAVYMANDTPFGLNASIWSKDMLKARRVSTQINSGNVCINDVMIGIANPYLPYGGNKESGFGRYHGPEGLLSFSHIVSVTEHRGKKKRELQWYPYGKEQKEAVASIMRALYGRSFRMPIAEWRNILKQFSRKK